MQKKVLLVAHCGPDSTYLKTAIRAADKDAQVLSANDSQSLQAALAEGIDLALINRELSYGFPQSGGVELIGWLKRHYPAVKSMLVSNYPDAQASALANGALPGFGKRELGTQRVVNLLREALSDSSPAPAPGADAPSAGR